MQMLAQCPRCSQTLMLSLSAADRRLRCPTCGRMFKVPPLEQLSKAMEVIKNAKGTVFVDENGNTYA